MVIEGLGDFNSAVIDYSYSKRSVYFTYCSITTGTMCFQQYLDVHAVMCVSSMLYLHYFSQTEPAQRVDCMALPHKGGVIFLSFFPNDINK